ncbi:MAG: PKD domain-containing protein [Promethearchaeota archaeon]
MDEGDRYFNVSDEFSVNFPSIGLIEVLKLVDLDLPGGVLWYEKGTGLFLNGTMKFYGGYVNYTMELANINMDFGILYDINPMADFKAFFNNSDPETPVQFIFTRNPGNGQSDYIWNFGDGNITLTNLQIITHQYTTQGIYNVILTVMDSDGDVDQKIKELYITVEVEDEGSILGYDTIIIILIVPVFLLVIYLRKRSLVQKSIKKHNFSFFFDF